MQPLFRHNPPACSRSITTMAASLDFLRRAVAAASPAGPAPMMTMVEDIIGVLAPRWAVVKPEDSKANKESKGPASQAEPQAEQRLKFNEYKHENEEECLITD